MNPDFKLCTFCSEEIRATAIKCRYCGSMLAEAGWVGPLEPGVVIREYRVEALLGRGGMGEVYRAEHSITRQKAAIKVLSPEWMGEERVRSRFVEEARILEELKHPNIVALRSIFQEGGRLFLVMEFVDGEDLAQVLERRPLDVEEAVRITTAVLSALDYAHNRPLPVIHRDIKPANVMLKKDGTVVVTDFGIAKALGRDRETGTRGLVGTFEYMSPEQIKGQTVTPASDVYSTGVTLYKMLAGVAPFPQTTDVGSECLTGHLTQHPPPLSEFREGLPAWLEAVGARALD